MDDLIDIVIPRGGEALIQRVCAEAKMPVLKHFSGNCHLYVDKDADLNMARSITVNAKCQRMGVCNAAESLIVHKEISAAFLPECSNELAAQGIEIRADESARVLIPSATKASESDYATEYLGPKISVVVVDSLDSAIRHINQYGSRHTDAIISNNQNAIDRFTSCVDTAAVMMNCDLIITSDTAIAHLAGALKAHSILPVIGVPLPGGISDGMDSLLSTVQMPKGVPVATMSVGKSGMINAAILCAEIFALNNSETIPCPAKLESP